MRPDAAVLITAVTVLVSSVHDRAVHCRSVHDWSVHDRAKLVRSVHDWSVHDRALHCRSKHDWSGHDKAELIRSVHDRTVLIRGVHAKAELIRGVHDGAVLVRSVDVMRLHESTVQHSAMPGRRTPGRGVRRGREARWSHVGSLLLLLMKIEKRSNSSPLFSVLQQYKERKEDRRENRPTHRRT